MAGKFPFAVFVNTRSLLFLLFASSLFFLDISTIYAQDTNPSVSENTLVKYNNMITLASCQSSIFAVTEGWVENDDAKTLLHSVTVEHSGMMSANTISLDSGLSVTTYFTRRKKAADAETVGSALSDLQSSSNKLPYLNAINQKFYKDKPGDATRQKIDAVLEDRNYDLYMVMLTHIYFESLNRPEEQKEIADLFTDYLNRGDYFSERLSLEIDRQKASISEHSYHLKLTELLKRYSDKINLTDSDGDPRKVSALVMLFCAEVDSAGKKLSALEQIAAVVIALLPFIFTFLMSRRTLKLAEKNLQLAIQNYKLAERKEQRETEKSLIVEPKEEEVIFYYRK